MTTPRTAWHVGFFRRLEQGRPRCFEVRGEVPLGKEPQRVDVLLLRRVGLPDDSDRAQTLCGLWPRIRRDAVVEYKSPTAGYRSSDLVKLLGYGAQYYAAETERMRDLEDLTLVLVVPHRTPLLDAEAAAAGWNLGPSNRGYAYAAGRPFG